LWKKSVGRPSISGSSVSVRSMRIVPGRSAQLEWTVVRGFQLGMRGTT
jgi:hypothetical protein